MLVKKLFHLPLLGSFVTTAWDWPCFIGITFISTFITSVSSLHLVVVPSIFNETAELNRRDGTNWIKSKTIHQKYNVSVAKYQRHFSDRPSYVKNQGNEAGVYLRYIVDNYHNFPDIAVFVHAIPHAEKWPDILGCIRPNATFSFLNPRFYSVRNTHYEAWYT